MVKLMQAKGYKVNSLADVNTPELYSKVVADFGTDHPNLVKRLQYIHFAQLRYGAMVEAWRKGDLAEVGAIFRKDGLG